MLLRLAPSFGLLALCCAAPAFGQRSRLAGNGFRLSKHDDFSTEDRLFARADTLFVELAVSPFDLPSDLKGPLQAQASLDDGESTHAIPLTRTNQWTFAGALALEELPAGSSWLWSAAITAETSTLHAPSALLSIEPEPEPDFAVRYGMNASENVWYERGIAFADAMARAGEFCTVVDGLITRDLVPVIPLAQDPPLVGEGWPDVATLAPDAKVGARLFGSMGGTLPDGTVVPYVLTWQGAGACRLDGPAVIGETNRTDQRVEVFVDPAAGGGNALLIWVVDGADSDDPVRDAHVWLPGMEAEKPVFWPPFVAKLADMNGGRGPHLWRAMDWCKVNEYGRTTGSAPFVFDLAGRIRPSSPSQGTKRGVCPEFAVALCNALGVNLHFNLPHPANGISDPDYDAFVSDALVRIRDGSPAVPGINGGQPFAGLADGLSVTIELSNELWNPGFPAHNWMKARAQANARTLEQEIALQLERVFGLARSVFSGPDAGRLRTFVGGRVTDSGFLADILAELELEIDAVGPAAYFKPRSQDVTAWLVGASGQTCPSCPSAEEVVASARLAIPDLAPHLAAHRALADAYANPDGSHPALELYEAGQAFVANFQPWWTAAAEAQRIPAMFQAYVDDFVPLLVEQGVDVVNWYSFLSDYDAHGNGTGPFGHWDRMDQTITLPVSEPYLDEGAPKAAAIYKLPPLRPE